MEPEVLILGGLLLAIIFGAAFCVEFFSKKPRKNGEETYFKAGPAFRWALKGTVRAFLLLFVILAIRIIIQSAR